MSFSRVDAAVTTRRTWSGRGSFGPGRSPGPVSYFWQADDGTGVFDDIVGFGAGEAARAGGTTFTVTEDLVGFALRVRAVYMNANGDLEQVYSDQTEVVEVNVAPVITTLSASVAENTLLATTVVAATDANAGDVVTFSVVGGADAAKFTINAVTGALSFLSAPDFEVPGC